MIELPDHINIENFQEFLENYYPPHDITVRDDDDVVIVDDTESLLLALITTAYRKLYMAYHMDDVDQPLQSTATYLTAAFYWRAEGSMSARRDLIDQGVIKAGVVKETYDNSILPFPAEVRDMLEPYERTVAIHMVQVERPMNDGIWRP